MSEQFRNPKVFAVVAVLFAVTTWLNWTAAPAPETHATAETYTAQIQIR